MIAGVAADVRESAEGEPYLSVRSDIPLFTLNSSIWGGGFGFRHQIVNRQVDKNYDCGDPVQEMEGFLRKQGLDPGLTAGMLTAAHVKQHGCSFMDFAGGSGLALSVGTWATVGLGNNARAGLTQSADKLFPGTINLIVVLDADLTEAAMVNAVITATEAKAAALQDLDVRVPGSGETATGTTTDAVVIAAAQRGVRCAYAGTGTQAGYLVGRTVYDAVKEAAERYAALVDDRKRMRAQ